MNTLPERLKRALEFDEARVLKRYDVRVDQYLDLASAIKGAKCEHDILAPIHERLIALVSWLESEFPEECDCNDCFLCDVHERLTALSEVLGEE